MTVHQEIAEMLLALSDLPASDPLVNCNRSGKLIALTGGKQQHLAVDSPLKKILLEALAYQREADVNSLCVSHGTIAWNDRPGIRTPLFILPLEWSWKRTQRSFSFEIDGQLHLNPYVRFYLSQLHPELEIPDVFSDDETDAFFSTFGTVDRDQFLGNFHVDRFSVFRDLKGVWGTDLSESISEIHGEIQREKFERTPLDLWFSFLDNSQRSAVLKAEQQSLALQGPPGTGKSQVLLNLIGRGIVRKERLLVVSEKKTALDVLEKKMQEQQLDRFSFVVHAQTSPADLLRKLRLTWTFIEDYRPGTTEVPVFHMKLKWFQQLIERLESKSLLGGMNFHDYRELMRNLPEVAPNPVVPDMNTWMQYENVIDYVLCSGWHVSPFAQCLFQRENVFTALSNALELSRRLRIYTLEELKSMYRSIHRCVLVENKFWKETSGLAGKPKEVNRFRKLVLETGQVTEELQLMEQQMAVWTRIPAPIELDGFEGANKSFWKKNPAKRLQKLLQTPVNLEEMVQKTRKFHQKQAKKLALHEKIRSFGFEPGTEALLVLEYIRALQQEDWSELAEIATWNKEARRTVISQRPAIESLYRTVSTFVRSGEGNLAEYIEGAIHLLNASARYREELSAMPPDLYDLLCKHPNFEELKAVIVYSNFTKAARQFPELASLDGSELHRLLDDLAATEAEETAISVRTVINGVAKQFREADELLRSNPAKLKEERKALRSRLKKGKALLVREFSKSKSHPSIRELLESDAGEWIRILLPVWMATPAQVADHFPLEKESFDLLLVDEGSQMPLPNAYGALYRSKSFVIAGDDRQMSPTSYFGKSVKWHDLFHQAEFHLEKAVLNHHYRSAQPELIAFSNRYFYNNELIVFPAAVRKKAIFLHRIDGTFEDSVNVPEAREIAKFLEQFNWETSLGVVAFSGEQLKCILLECSEKVVEKLESGQENGKVFVKTLEQVQGDEAATVVISMGYARNAEGHFRMQFGPVNHSNGFKRLNVLFSRAQEELHFFTSVDPGDFMLSENEGVNLLRRFVQFARSEPEQEKPVFPFGIQAKIRQNLLEVPQITSFTRNAQEILTFHEVMQQRGWKIRYEL